VITHVLDTSAILAHYLKEPGAEDVNRILSRGPDEIGVSILSLPELHTRLGELVSDLQEVERVFHSYTGVLAIPLPATRAVADAAIELRSKVRPRLPLVDAFIAATAKEQDAILVHRDPHMAAIPMELLKQLALPSKSNYPMKTR
jgi:predicted nucleic acid-binding protein